MEYLRIIKCQDFFIARLQFPPATMRSLCLCFPLALLLQLTFAPLSRADVREHPPNIELLRPSRFGNLNQYYRYLQEVTGTDSAASRRSSGPDSVAQLAALLEQQPKRPEQFETLEDYYNYLRALNEYLLSR